jgi:hypothetical protein
MLGPSDDAAAQAFKGALAARLSYPAGRDGLKNDDSLADNRVTAKAIAVGLPDGFLYRRSHPVLT